MDPEQALVWAETVRAERERLVNDVSNGSVSLAEVFDRASVDPQVAMVKALVVLEALVGSGKVIARRTMAGLGVDETVQIGELDATARAALIEAFA